MSSKDLNLYPNFAMPILPTIRVVPDKKMEWTKRGVMFWIRELSFTKACNLGHIKALSAHMQCRNYYEHFSVT